MTTAAPDRRHSVADPHTLPVDRVVEELGVDPGTGLDGAEAARRLDAVGPNRLDEVPPKPAWRVFVDQFRSGLFAILLGAAVVAAAVGDLKDSLVIAAVVVLNATIGFLQERKATRSLAALKEMLVPSATVRREGRLVTIDAEDLVPGDIVAVEAGARVPADGRVIQGHQAQADESSLTGESQPMDKVPAPLPAGTQLADRVNLLHAGTAVTRGRAEMVVVATGMATEMGRIAGMLDTTVVPRTPLQVQLDAVGRRVALLGVVAVVLYSSVALLRGETFSDLVIRGVALAVAAVPEGLPAVLALVLAAGVRRMAQQGAIVRRLASVETLGSATVVCTDKTGTLTRNEMTVRELATATAGGAERGGEARRALHRLLLCNDAGEGGVGEPMEVGLLRAAEEHGLDVAEERAASPRLAEVPFDATRKYMATLHQQGPSAPKLLAVKGAPDVLVGRCATEWHDGAARPLAEERRTHWTEVVHEMAGRGLRTLAVAERSFEGSPDSLDDAEVDGLVLLGVVGIADPPRDEAVASVAECRRAGIDVKMITGDHVVTAAAIAHEIGITGDAVSGRELDAMPPEELADRVESIGVFARVTPEHKVAIVEALTGRGHIVSMTGDGVNDAAALRAAHVGVAMGRTGTDVTKEAADLVLTDDNFATIVGAVRSGRGIYDNIVTFIRSQITTNIAAILTFVTAVLVGLPAPMTAVQVLWVNLLTDGPPALALGLDRPKRNVMSRAPRDAEEQILNGRRLRWMLGIAVVMVAGTLGALVLARDEPTAYAVTLAFTTFVLLQVVKALHVRSERESAFSRNLPVNRLLLVSLAGIVALQVAVVHVSWLQTAFDTVALRGEHWLFAAGVAVAALAVGEAEKAVRRRLHGPAAMPGA